MKSKWRKIGRAQRIGDHLHRRARPGQPIDFAPGVVLRDIGEPDLVNLHLAEERVQIAIDDAAIVLIIHIVAEPGSPLVLDLLLVEPGHIGKGPGLKRKAMLQAEAGVPQHLHRNVERFINIAAGASLRVQTH